MRKKNNLTSESVVKHTNPALKLDSKWESMYWHVVSPDASYSDSPFKELNRQLSKTIITHSALCPGQIVLNLSCDMGEVLREITSQLGGRIKVINVDPISYSLVDIRNSWQDEKSSYYISADFNKLPFMAQSFDRVVSRFGLNIVEDIYSSLTALHSVLKPEGIISIVMLNKLANTPLFKTVINHLKTAYPRYTQSGFENVFYTELNSNLEELLLQTGFRGIRSFERTVVRKFPAYSPSFWLFEVSLFLGHYISALPKENRKEFITAVTKDIKPFIKDDYYIIENNFKLTSAMR